MQHFKAAGILLVVLFIVNRLFFAHSNIENMAPVGWRMGHFDPDFDFEKDYMSPEYISNIKNAPLGPPDKPNKYQQYTEDEYTGESYNPVMLDPNVKHGKYVDCGYRKN